MICHSISMLEFTLELLLFLFPLAYSPGPGNMFFAASGARFGYTATLPANLGYHIATLVVTLAIGYGFDLVANEAPAFLAAIRYLGSAYVFYLAWHIFKAGAIEGKVTPGSATFIDGAVLLLLNPKAYLIIALMFSQFSSPDVAPFFVAYIAVIFTANNYVAFSLWAWLGDRMAAIFRNNTNARRLNRLFGFTLAIVALWILF